MLLPAVLWPDALHVITFGILLISLFLPWVFRRQHIFIIYLPALVASLFGLFCENQNAQAFWEDGPPTHAGIVFPLLFFTWVNASAAAVFSFLAEIDKKEYRSLASLCRPWSLTLSALVLSLVEYWISASDMDYSSPSSKFGLTTGGWFILCLPILMMFSVVFGFFFAMLARKLHLAIGWLCFLAAGGTMLVSAWRSALPMSRLADVVGIDLAQNTSIHRLVQISSLSDGTFTYGAISGADGLLDELILEHELESSSGALHGSIYSVLFDADALPIHDKVYANDRLTCFRNRETGQIFFEDCSRLSP
jgi:hypothetical protein